MSKQEKWLTAYKVEYLSRTGLTVSDAGWTDQDVIDTYYLDYNPVDAVMDQIERYDLTDISADVQHKTYVKFE